MMERHYQTQILDWDTNTWNEALLIVMPAMLSLMPPIKGYTYGLKINIKNKPCRKWVKIAKIPISLRIRFVSQSGKCISLRNWLRASFGKPFLCRMNNIVINRDEKLFKINVGFPLENPIIFKIPALEEQELAIIEQLCHQGKKIT